MINAKIKHSDNKKKKTTAIQQCHINLDKDKKENKNKITNDEKNNNNNKVVKMLRACWPNTRERKGARLRSTTINRCNCT